MKALGISAAVLTVLSFICWATSWVYWTFLYTASVNDFSSSLRPVIQGVSAFSSVTEFLAILLISIGLILAAGRLSKT